MHTRRTTRRMKMRNYDKNEIIEELWKIKDEVSFSCDKDIGKIVEMANKIAKEQTLLGEEVNLREKTQTAQARGV
jgi:hypothetical protein